MRKLTKFVVDQLRTNSMLQAAVIAGPVAMIANGLKQTPKAGWEKLKREACLHLRFNSDMENFSEVLTFVTDNVIVPSKLRSFKYNEEEVWEKGKTYDRRVLSMGYGTHTGKWQGRWCSISYEKEDSNATSVFKETLQITFLARNSETVRQFIDALRKYIERDKPEVVVELHLNGEHGWRKGGALAPRPINTIFTNGGEAEKALAHILEFEQKKAWYRKRGLPHHTGILLPGVPGTGKSSLIHALASETQRNIYYLNLGAIEKEADLMALFTEGVNWSRAFLVLEDIDSSGASVKRDQKGTVTLSTLLNILDGSLSPDGLVVLATTNHAEALDPALMRPGRFDLQLTLGPLEWEAFLGLCRLFELPEGEVMTLRGVFQPTPGAVLRGLIIQGGVEKLREHFNGGGQA